MQFIKKSAATGDIKRTGCSEISFSDSPIVYCTRYSSFNSEISTSDRSSSERLK